MSSTDSLAAPGHWRLLEKQRGKRAGACFVRDWRSGARDPRVGKTVGRSPRVDWLSQRSREVEQLKIFDLNLARSGRLSLFGFKVLRFHFKRKTWG